MLSVAGCPSRWPAAHRYPRLIVQLETDSEFRGSYADKIFNRSSRMLESIKSAILMNVQGVKSIAPYENPSHEFDAYGRYPNSVEIVIEGGDPTEIALQILDAKAGGINTFGDVVVTVPGEYGEDIPIRFNRPMPVYTWFRTVLTVSATEALPPNYAALVKEIIVDEMEGLAPGQNAVPQRFIADIYKRVSGVDYVDIYLFTTTDASRTPGSYDRRSAVITPRQKARTDDTMIEVVLDG